MDGGYLWMDTRISLDPYLIWKITKLSKQGKDPTKVFMDKTRDKQLTEKLKKKYGKVIPDKDTFSMPDAPTKEPVFKVGKTHKLPKKKKPA